MNKKHINDVYTEYYLSQAGSGIGNVYSGSVYQKGHGIGSYLGGLFRCVFPLIKSGSKVLGSELLKSTANIISDISRSEDPAAVIKRRGKETINNLGHLVGEKMFGSGYNSQLTSKKRQLLPKSRTVKKAKQSKKKGKQITTKGSKRQKVNNKKKQRCKEQLFDIFA